MDNNELSTKIDYGVRGYATELTIVLFISHAAGCVK